MKSVTVVEVSQNRKIGPVSATYVSQKSCPKDCPLLEFGCYAEHGPVGYHTRRLNQGATIDPVGLARLEAQGIRNLSGQRDLRLHVVGDCRTNTAAAIVARAARHHGRKSQKTVWTYTHAWRKVRRESWMDVSVLASVESLPDIRETMEQGYAAAVIVSQFRQPTPYLQDDLLVIPCLYQTLGMTCLECRLCLDDQSLLQRRAVIAFQAHGVLAGRVRQRLPLPVVE